MDKWENCYDDGFMEEWKNIDRFEGQYQISNLGRVWSVKNLRILKPERIKNGYLRIRLSFRNFIFRLLIHRLVLEHFVSEQPSPIHQCNHKNGNKEHNNYKNLEWVTPSENMLHAIKIGTKVMPKGENHYHTKLKPEDIKRIRLLRYKFSHQVAEEYGVKAVSIRAIWARLNWKHIK